MSGCILTFLPEIDVDQADLALIWSLSSIFLVTSCLHEDTKVTAIRQRWNISQQN